MQDTLISFSSHLSTLVSRGDELLDLVRVFNPPSRWVRLPRIQRAQTFRPRPPRDPPALASSPRYTKETITLLVRSSHSLFPTDWPLVQSGLTLQTHFRVPLSTKHRRRSRTSSRRFINIAWISRMQAVRLSSGSLKTPTMALSCEARLCR